MHAVALLDDTAEERDSRCWPLGGPAARTAIAGAQQPDDDALKFSKPAHQPAAAAAAAVNERQAPLLAYSLPAVDGRLPLSCWAAPEGEGSESSWDSVHPRIAETPQQPPGGPLSDYEGFSDQGAAAASGYGGGSGGGGERFGDSGLNSGGTTCDTWRQTGGREDLPRPWDEGGEARFITHCAFALALQVGGQGHPRPCIHGPPTLPSAACHKYVSPIRLSCSYRGPHLLPT